MKTVEKCADQGDVRFCKIEKLPEGLKLASEGKTAIVAHSETGHHHIAESTADCQYFEDPNDPFTCYLQLAEPAELKHLRPYDTHESWQMPAGIWMFRRQREYTPEGYRMVQD